MAGGGGADPAETGLPRTAWPAHLGAVAAQGTTGVVRRGGAEASRALQWGAVVALAWVAAVMWTGGDAGWREWMVVPALTAAGLGGWPLWMGVLRRSGARGWWWGGILAAGLAGVAGGLRSGAPWLVAAGAGLVWWLAVAGLGAMLAGVVARGLQGKVALLLTLGFAGLVVTSLLGYAAGAERWMLSEWMSWGDLQKRLGVIWPCRWWSAGAQLVWWEHPNIGAWYFGCGFGLVTEAVWRRRTSGWRSGAPLLVLAAAAVCALFLTASRSGYLVLVAVLPAVLVGRPWRCAAMVAGVLAAGGLTGWLALELKVPPAGQPAPAPPQQAPAPQPVPTPPPPAPAPDPHDLRSLVGRRDAGRLATYRLWAEQEMPGHWWVGRGVAATGKPISGGLPHEHSMWVATVRGGGLCALAGQLVLLAGAGWSAWRLARAGSRACLLLWLATLAGFLFDRSSVFRATASVEFFAWWTTVWLPLVLTSRGAAGQLRKGSSGASASTR